MSERTNPNYERNMRALGLWDHYQSLLEYQPGMLVRCPTKNIDGSEAEECRGCGSNNVKWDGDVYDCLNCGIFFSCWAADPPHRRYDQPE